MIELYNFLRITIFFFSVCFTFVFLGKGEIIFSLACATTVGYLLKLWLIELNEQASYNDNYNVSYHTRYYPNNESYWFKNQEKEREKTIKEISKNMIPNKNIIEIVKKEIKNEDVKE
jgi:hypothetical protein